MTESPILCPRCSGRVYSSGGGPQTASVMKQEQFSTRDGSLSHHHHHQARYFSLLQEGRDDFLNLDPLQWQVWGKALQQVGHSVNPGLPGHSPCRAWVYNPGSSLQWLLFCISFCFPSPHLWFVGRGIPHTLSTAAGLQSQRGSGDGMRVQCLTAVGGSLIRVRSYPSSAQRLLWEPEEGLGGTLYRTIHRDTLLPSSSV